MDLTERNDRLQNEGLFEGLDQTRSSKHLNQKNLLE